MKHFSNFMILYLGELIKLWKRTASYQNFLLTSSVQIKNRLMHYGTAHLIHGSLKQSFENVLTYISQELKDPNLSSFHLEFTQETNMGKLRAQNHL